MTSDNDKNTHPADDAVEGVAEKKIKKRSNLARNQLVILFNFAMMLIFVAVLGLGIWYYSEVTAFDRQGPLEETSVILIKPGTGIREIAADLETQNMIRSHDTFINVVTLLERKGSLLKAGEYEIAAHASMREIMDVLVRGKSIEHSFTVPEGLTVQQIFERLRQNDVLSGDLPQTLPPEGSLMTDTVSFIRGTSRSEIVRRLASEQKKLVDAIWAKRAPDLPLKNINEMVTLASIVEKETGVASERPQVAAVFYNRLANNMRLQSDPTVIYGIFGGRGKPADRPIYRSDLDRETPYNTYKINGLPPTPIANPGKAALEAVANPPKTDALYFVADGTGGHIFAKSLDEHNSNVRKWREIEKSRTSPMSGQ